jgi:hypothetical protein
MINMEGEQLRLEQKLREMSMGSEDYTTYASRFHDLLVGLGSAKDFCDPASIHFPYVSEGFTPPDLR